MTGARNRPALNRRSLLKAGAALGAASAVPLAAAAAARAQGTTLLVFDSRLPESRAFAAGALRGGPRLDVAREAASRWAGLRGPLPAFGRVEGLTGWSDWIALRGELEARGLRLAAENPASAPLSGKAHLFRWSMQAR